MSALSGGSAASAGASTTTTSESSSVSTTSLTQSIDKLDGSMATGQSNYHAWRFRIIRILKEKGVLEAIEDSEDSISPRKDNQAFTIITLNIKDSQIPYIQDASSTRDAWKSLKEVHQGIGMNGRMILMQRLWGLKITEADDTAQHLNQFRELANQLSGLSQDGKGMEDSELATILTLSLPESYEPLVMALQSRSDTITFDMMAGRLLQESGRRHISHISQTPYSRNHSPQTAFTAQRPPTGVRGGRGRTGPGHTYNGRGRGGFRTRTREIHSSGQTGTEVRRNIPALNTQVPMGTKCYYCGKGGHWKKDCYKRKLDESAGSSTSTRREKEFTFLAENPNTIPESSWVIDSGASQHLCRDRMQFVTYRNVSDTQMITIADGTKIHAHGTGEIEIHTALGVIQLTDVWQVPTIGASLMSVARIVDAGYMVGFEQLVCYVSKDGVTGLFLSNENTIGPAVDLLALVLREASRDRR